ncbi:MAG: hypothetical protein FWG75_06400, partial [Cystobacterineae bacterium]|nr:hypothetical protein [Cystobacterineae bacterium]
MKIWKLWGLGLVVAMGMACDKGGGIVVEPSECEGKTRGSTCDNGNGICEEGTCRALTLLVACEDGGDFCANEGESCIEESGIRSCQIAPSPMPCDGLNEGDACDNGNGTCNAEGNCVPNTVNACGNNETLCGNNCCDNATEVCNTTNNTCQPITGLTCGNNETLCGNNCCDNATEVCNTTNNTCQQITGLTCGNNETLCGNNCCDNATEVCNTTNNTCQQITGPTCGNNETLCGNNCCDNATEVCNTTNNTCQQITGLGEIGLNAAVDPNRATLTPLINGAYSERYTTVSVVVSGFDSAADANSVQLAIGPVTGLSFQVASSTEANSRTFTV